MGVWSSRNLLVYAIANFIFGLAVLSASFEVFFMRRWAARLLIGLSAAGLLSQIVRLSIKLPLASNDAATQALLVLEGALGFVYLFFIFLLVGNDFKERLEAHWSFVSHQEFDRKKTSGAAA